MGFDWLKKMTVPLFSIKISWGGGRKAHVEKLSLGGIPVYKDKEDHYTPDGRKVFYKLLEDPEWRPYCLVCDTMKRMILVDEHFFECTECKNYIGSDMKFAARVGGQSEKKGLRGY